MCFSTSISRPVSDEGVWSSAWAFQRRRLWLARYWWRRRHCDPVLAVGVIPARRGDDGAAQHAQHFRNGDRDQACLRAGVGIAVHGDGDGQVDASEQAQSAPAMPGLHADHLAGVQSGDLPGELVILFDFPLGLRDADQPGQRHRFRCPAPVGRHGSGVAVLAGQQNAVPVIAAVAGVSSPVTSSMTQS